MGELPPPFVVLQDVVFGEPIEALAVDVLRRVEAEPVDAEVQPELCDRLHRATHAGIVEIEVRHVAAEYALIPEPFTGPAPRGVPSVAPRPWIRFDRVEPAPRRGGGVDGLAKPGM